jgi:hypothetical protein
MPITFFWPRHERPLAPSITRPPARRRRRRRRLSSSAPLYLRGAAAAAFRQRFSTPFLRFFRRLRHICRHYFIIIIGMIAPLHVAFAAITLRCDAVFCR